MSFHDYHDVQFQTLIAAIDTPSFLRRQQAVEAAWNSMINHCQRQRDAWLEMPKLRFRQWAAASGPITDVTLSALNIDAKSYVDKTERQPKSSRATLSEQLQRSVLLFNRRWSRFSDELDLSEVNRLRKGYNDFYLLEKECAGVSPRVARYGFEPLPPATAEDLLAMFPLVDKSNIAAVLSSADHS